MNIGVTSAVLATVVCLTVAIAILFRRPRRPLYARFSIFSFALSLWHTASFVSRLSGAELGRFQIAAGLTLPPLGVLFFRELLRDRSASGRRLMRATTIISALFFLLNLSPFGSSMWARLPMGLYVLGVLLVALRGLRRHARKARSETESQRLSYLLYGGVGAFVLGFGDLIPSPGFPAALGHVAVTFYVYFLYQSVVARRLIDIGELLGKTAVLAVLTLVLATVYSVLVLWVGSDQQGLWLFNTLVASFVILILYDQVRPFVEEATAKALFRERYKLRQVVRQLLQELRTIISIDEMAERVLESLHSGGRAAYAMLYLSDEGEFAFTLIDSRGGAPPKNINMVSHPSLLRQLRHERRPLLLEQLSHRYDELPNLLTGGDPALERELERTAEAISAMRQLNAAVLMPMVAQERTVGLLALGNEHAGDAYSTDEITSLMSVAEACAVVIENSHEYEKRRERDRLAAVGEMATGMAHEIRNPLGAIKGAAQCLDPASLPHDAREFVQVIVEEVDRLNGVVGQFLEYARPWRGNPVPTDINNVVLATLKLLGHDKVPRNIKISHDLALKLPRVNIDPEQLRQVIINLLLNAVQAMPPDGGSIVVKTAVSHLWLPSAARQNTDPKDDANEHSRSVVLRVSDTGSGIRPEDLSSIFVPFFTTKQHGTGLGLAISQRIMENAGGRIEVTSRLRVGTTFTLRMPSIGS